MAKGIRESEEEFNDQFVLDDESLDDLSLDDDALFADLDNEIRLDGDQGGESAGNGGSDAAADEAGDLDLDLDGEDMGKLEIDLGDEDETAAAAGGGDSAEEGLDDLLGDSAESAGEGLDDLLGDSGEDVLAAGGAGDGLDDLLGDSGEDVLAGGAGDGLDDLLGDSGGDDALAAGTDDGLDDLLGEGGPEGETIDLGDADADEEGLEELFADEGEGPAADAAGGDEGEAAAADAAGGEEVNLNAFEEELGQDNGEGGVSEISFDDDDLGDLNLDLGAEEITVDVGEDEEAGDKEEIDLDLSDVQEGGAEEEISAEDLGEEEFELPPLDEEGPSPADAEELDFGDVDEETFGAPEGPDVSMTVSVAHDDVDDISLDEGEAGGEEEFQAAPDVDSSELDFHLGSLDDTIAEDTFGAEEVEEEPFSVGDIPTFDSAGLDLGEGGLEEDEDFTAVADVNLERDEVLELNLDNLEEGAGGDEFSNVPPLAGEDVLEVPPDMSYEAPTRPAAGMEAYPTRAAPSEPAGISTEILLSVPHQINVEMGSISLRGQDILELNYGSVVPLDRTVGEPVDLVLEGRAIAQGEIVLINGKNLGVRIVAVNK